MYTVNQVNFERKLISQILRKAQILKIILSQNCEFYIERNGFSKWNACKKHQLISICEVKFLQN